jgi:hypothetical protein
MLPALESAELESYPDKDRLLAAFHRMQDFQVGQIKKAAGRSGHRVRAIREPLEYCPAALEPDAASNVL